MEWPLSRGCRYRTAGIASAASSGTEVAGGSSNNVKGDWVTLDAAIPAGVVGFWLIQHYHGSTTEATRLLIDIGVGATPTVIVSNLYTCKRVEAKGELFPIPMALPAGEALKVRFQGQTGAKYSRFSVLYKLAGPLPSAPLGHSDTYGAETANTSGITVDPGGTSHTKGSWTQIVAATTRAMKSFVVIFGGSEEQSAPPNRPAASWLFDIGIGPDPPTIILPDIGVTVNSTSDSLNGSVYGPFECDIPSGTRLAARCQSSLTDATDRLLDLVIIGFS